MRLYIDMTEPWGVAYVWVWLSHGMGLICECAESWGGAYVVGVD